MNLDDPDSLSAELSSLGHESRSFCASLWKKTELEGADLLCHN